VIPSRFFWPLMKKWTEEQAESAALDIIDRFYAAGDPELKRMLLKHSFQVLGKAREIMSDPANDRMVLDPGVVTAGSLLHDVGISKCHAPDIYCFGTEPYIAHGIIGGELLRELGRRNGTEAEMEVFARICERHTGTGLSAEDIRRQHLPLPERDFRPETPEEKLICLADKFYSKSGTMEEKKPERILRSMEKFGPETIARWHELCREFHLEPI